jgi:hypothetical protein
MYIVCRKNISIYTLCPGVGPSIFAPAALIYMMMMCMRAQLDITGVIAAYYEIINTFLDVVH